MKQCVARALTAAAFLLPLQLAAQVRSSGFAGVHPRGFTLSFGSQRHSPNAFSHQAIFLGEPMLYPDYYQPPPVSPPQVVVLQVPAPAQENKSLESKEEAKGVHPLLIEWQENRFVRVTSAEQNPTNRHPVLPGYAAEVSVSNDSLGYTRELPPALLIFRDGHREETANYAITDGVLYAYPDYWTGGAWAKRILISDLDLPATFQQNQQRGVKFILPAAPNQVVTRP
jgi:hypothetical protein